ncbi:MAG: sulfotransferase [Erythrobacter sp.]|uniref:sulfotransferase family protein n=1 Tax=Erythrobacter sp. TaxID=1042 RepID=UPI0032EB5A58
MPKIFCIGFQKTGTSSMNQALTQLGYNVASYYGDGLSYHQLRDRFVSMGLELARRHDAVEDMPWPLLYKELDQAFPSAKFILTERDVDRWFASVLKHFGDKPSARRQLIYGEDAAFPKGNEQRYREVYLAHNAEVRAYFSKRPDDLLILNLENGDGWEKLRVFLGREDAPDGQFVHANKASERWKLSYLVRSIRSRLIRSVRR